jgi:hypothetical protein
MAGRDQVISSQTSEAPLENGIPFALKEYCRLLSRRPQRNIVLRSYVAGETSMCLVFHCMAGAVAVRLGTSEDRVR